jgi:CubicO group peptidase (beta-lactamase class C family)
MANSRRVQRLPYNTIFNVASLAKTITNLMTLKLVSNGQWKLDEPLDKYWVDPDLKSDPSVITSLTTRSILNTPYRLSQLAFYGQVGQAGFPV